MSKPGTKREGPNVTNIYKIQLDFEMVQTISCNALQILDLQIQNGRPCLWIMTSDDPRDKKNITIIMAPTGPDIIPLIGEFTYISTTQCDGFVWHWFTDFNPQRDRALRYIHKI